MFYWVHLPFVRIVIFFILGIMASIFSVINFNLALVLLIISVVAYFIIFFNLKYVPSLYLQSTTGLIFFLIIFLSGYLINQNYNQRNLPDPQLFDSNYHFYLAVIKEASEEKGNTFKSLAEVVKIKIGDDWQDSHGRLLVYHPTDSLPLKYGDLILVKGAAQEVRPPANPGEFNYQQYLSYENIYFQHFLRPGTYWLIRNKAVTGIAYYLSELRQRCIKVFQNNIHHKRERDIALALVLGMKSGLDNDVREAYSAAGAMHVLAVSGLHVGMIYGIVLFLFGKIKLIKGGRFLFAALALIILWTYAGITGLPASVLRAVTMLSVIVIAQAINRQTNIYNSLAIAAMILLIYNPAFIMSVGFQLSFLAVVGIVYFFPKIYNLVHADFWLTDRIWFLTSIAIAAQLATFPISIYYFHQFPVYFFLSNLIVIPAAFVILGNGLAVLIFSFSETILNILSYVLESLIYLVNQAVFALEYIPYHIITDLHLTTLQTMLIYSFIIFIAAFIHLKNYKQLWWAGLCAVIFTGIWLHSFFIQVNQHKIIFYSISNLSAVDFIEGKSAMLWLGEDAGKHLSKLKFHVIPARIKSGLSTEIGMNRPSDKYLNVSSFPSSNYSGNHLLVFNQYTILMVDQPFEDVQEKFSNLTFDFLVMRNNYKANLEDLVNQINFKKLLIDGSNNFYHTARFEKEAEILGLDFHSTRTMGALVVDFKNL